MRRMRRSRKQQAFIPNIDTEAWLAENPGIMIECPSQPGKLRLTKEACARRHMTANEPRWAKIGAEPFHIFVFKMNLVPCRECKIGAQHAKEFNIEAQAA